MQNQSSQVRQIMSTAQSELAKSPANDYNTQGNYSHMSLDQLEFNVYTLQQDRMALSIRLDFGGEYVSDGYDCVDFEHYTDGQIKNWTQQIAEIDFKSTVISELIKNRKIAILCQELK